jgi:hypothetical protein
VEKNIINSNFSLIQKVNKNYWFFYIKKNYFFLYKLYKKRISINRTIFFIKLLLNRRKPIFINRFRKKKKKQINYYKLIPLKNIYRIFFNNINGKK